MRQQFDKKTEFYKLKELLEGRNRTTNIQKVFGYLYLTSFKKGVYVGCCTPNDASYYNIRGRVAASVTSAFMGWGEPVQLTLPIPEDRAQMEFFEEKLIYLEEHAIGEWKGFPDGCLCIVGFPTFNILYGLR